MTGSLTEVLLWLFVINLGIAFGAGLYESRIVVPQWLVPTESGYEWNRAAALQANTGLRFWIFVTTIPLTLLTLASLVGSFWTEAPVRGWWLTAGLAALVDRSMTFAYFIPTMLRLMREETLSQGDAVATALRWVRLGYVRHAATLVAWLAALKALTLLRGVQ
ncbi:MAG TPA: DUF1772 domain-containing protein [Vicinamibacteria bacterium]|nr:DUF1772 domain-containing protein [Vicinamibacteria bacterium]